MFKNLKNLIVLISTIAFLQTAQAVETNEETLPIAELQEFADIFIHIKNNFVQEVSDKQLLEFATKGMLANLDPHSDYLDTEEFEFLKNNSSGKYFGLGVELTIKNGNLTIVTALDGSPAQNAGLESGDIIESINNKPTKNMSILDASKILSKDAKSKKTLTISRKNHKPFKVVLEPNWVAETSVKYNLLEKNFGYIRISQFQDNTGFETSKALKALESKNNGKLLGLVIDLRNNPGGVLQAAVDVANNFLADGLIVYTQGRSIESEMSFSATSENTNLETYLVVLINSGTASSAEIVAGAIQDRRRGIIAGTPSFGKGSVQEVVSLANGKGLQLTTAMYYTPNGRSIQAQGIVPDLILKKARLIRDKSDSSNIYERDLIGHLVNKNQKLQVSREAKDLTDDFILYEALNILKGLTLFEVAP